MDDYLLFVLFEYVLITYPVWYIILKETLQIIITKLLRYYYIKKTNDTHLAKVIITYHNIIIFCNLINLNYYNIKFKRNNKYINIVGNKTYINIGLQFNKLITTYNKLSLIYKSNKVNIYVLPIYTYPKEECCICYDNESILVGLCGHQNVCKICIQQLDRCPVCNNTSICDRVKVNNLIT